MASSIFLILYSNWQKLQWKNIVDSEDWNHYRKDVDLWIIQWQMRHYAQKYDSVSCVNDFLSLCVGVV